MAKKKAKKKPAKRKVAKKKVAKKKPVKKAKKKAAPKKKKAAKPRAAQPKKRNPILLGQAQPVGQTETTDHVSNGVTPHQESQQPELPLGESQPAAEDTSEE